MITRKMMALAAIPVAAVLAGGGVAVAQAAGTPAPPAPPAVVQQATVQHSDPCHGQLVTSVTARHDGDQPNCDSRGMGDRVHADHGQVARSGSGVTARVSCGDDHGDE